MFGYIIPEKQELKVREYELFRAYYCGICKSIKMICGQFPRISLSYDTTFLALVLSLIIEDKSEIVPLRCMLHPSSKKPVVINNKAVDYAADMNVILAYNNLQDDWKDERKVKSALALTLLRNGRNKAAKRYPNHQAEIKKRLDQLHNLEREKCNSMDRAAEPFALIMEYIFENSGLVNETANKSALKSIGYNTGKWIYILDAYDDIERDIKSNNYNPLVLQFNYKGQDILNFKREIHERVIFNLTYCLSQLSKAFDRLVTKGDRAIVDNIVYLGMLRKTESILEIGSCVNSEKSV